MSFPKYDKRTISDIPWIDHVPAHWRRTIAYSVLREKFTPNIGVSESNLLSLSFGNIVRKDINTNDGLLPVSFETYQIVERDDIVFRPTDLQNDWNSLRNAIARERGIITSAYIVVESLGASAKFLNCVFRSYDHCKVFYSMGGGLRQAFKFSDIKRLPIYLPPLAEQTAIAAFLDRETAKIDELVGEQRRLIELLKEKRQAVISHAVTKGLNPHAPLKPSGIEWLGDVPEHWKIPRLCYYATVENGTTPSRENLEFWSDGDVPWLSSGEVNQYRITEANECITQKALDECSLRLLPKGTIVTGMIGQGKTRGLAASLEIEATINQNLAAIVPNENLKSDYLLYIFQSVYDYLREFGRGGNQAALNCEILSALRVPLPPSQEQTHICDFLEERLQAFNTLTAEAERGIELLQERRTALISAAVTGKIDVRGLTPTEAL